MVRWSPAECRRLGIPLPTDQVQSAETKRRIGVEDSLTADLVFQLTKAHGLPEPQSKLNGPQFKLGKWPWDLAYPEHQLVIDLQGLHGHTRIPAYIKDCEKFAFAVMNGFVPLPVVSPHIKSGQAAMWISCYIRDVSQHVGCRNGKPRKHL